VIAHRGIGILIMAGMILVARAQGQRAGAFDGDSRAIAAGAALFANRCSECHGADAKGNNGPDLTALWLSGVEDSRVFDSIRLGVADTVMPPSMAPDDELWAIIAYLKSVSTVPAFVSASGDSLEGRARFDSMCASCHLVRGQGGSLGPELSNIAQVRSREALISAIREPDAIVPAEYRTVTVMLPEGRDVRGIKKGEDAFSIQLVDSDGRLRSFIKDRLERVIYEDVSLMPAFGRRELSNRELEDLLAYLSTLRVANGKSL
jgi:putative heme-binding domain-containing protein